VGQAFAGRSIAVADDFAYTDPVDGSLTSGQGLRLLLDDGSRVVLRLSGTGTQGATLRVYLESYVPPSGNLAQDPQAALADLIGNRRTGRDQEQYGHGPPNGDHLRLFRGASTRRFGR